MAGTAFAILRNAITFSPNAEVIACEDGQEFSLAVASVLLWLASGPIFAYSDTWQLVIHTSTTIVTFLMVFLIQRTQNKEALAMN